MQVTVPPPTQIVPSASCVTWTRPARPSAVPWPATYGAVDPPGSGSASRPATRSGCPSPGSSTVAPFCGKNARTSNAAVEPGGYGPTTPRSTSTKPGSIARTSARRRQQDGDPAGSVVDPLRVHDRGPRDAAGRRRCGRPSPRRPVRSRSSGGSANASTAVVGAPDPDQAGGALLDDHCRVARDAAGLEPGVARPERRVAGERQLGGRA